MKADLSKPAAGIVQAIQHELAIQGNHTTSDAPRLQLLGGRWSSNTASASANFVLIFAGHPEPALVVQHEKILTRHFGIGASLVPKAGFSCVRIYSVPILSNAYEPADLQREVLQHPHLKGMTFIHPPRWFFKDHGGRTEDSILITVFDLTNRWTPLLTRRPLWMFGAQCKARRFDSRPVLRQCDGCYRLSHAMDRCPPHDPNFVHCRHCGGGHSSDQHEVKCPTWSLHKDGVCACGKTCVNCKDARKPAKTHDSFHPSCPLRKMYRDPNAPHEEFFQDQDPSLRIPESKEDVDTLADIDAAPALPSQTLITEHAVVTCPTPPAVPTACIDEVEEEL